MRFYCEFDLHFNSEMRLSLLKFYFRNLSRYHQNYTIKKFDMQCSFVDHLTVVKVVIFIAFINFLIFVAIINVIILIASSTSSSLVYHLRHHRCHYQ